MAGVTGVAAVDNDRMLLDGLAAWFAGRPDLRLVAAVPTVDELLAAPAGGIDVVMLDLILADRSDPVANVRRLTAAGHPVLVVSVHAVHGPILATFGAGARGYLAKDHDLATVAAALREVAGGGLAYTPELATACLQDPRPDRPPLAPVERAVLSGCAAGMTPTAVARQLDLSPETVRYCLHRIATLYRRPEAVRPAAPAPRSDLFAVLTMRERQIAWLVTEGLSNQQVARRLGVTAKTVEKHLSRVMTKLGVRSRAGVAGLVGGVRYAHGDQ